MVLFDLAPARLAVSTIPAADSSISL